MKQIVVKNKQAVLAFRGTYALIGNVPIEFPRDLFFQKEAGFVIARAAGPCRYDVQYEDQGRDYPRSYVRWTEGRNMEEFVPQLEAGRISIGSLMTHEYAAAEAPQAYEALHRDVRNAMGVLLRYDS